MEETKKYDVKKSKAEANKVNPVNHNVVRKNKSKTNNFVTEEKKERTIEGIGVVDCACLNVRKKPDSSSDVISKVRMGDPVTIISPFSSDDDWLKISVDNKEGYCMSKFIKTITRYSPTLK